MNILNKVTLKSLRKNKVRTIVTIIGVILSAAMITAVTTFITSLQDYMVRSMIDQYGDWHLSTFGVDAAVADTLRGNPEVQQVGAAADVGYARLEDSANESKPYLFVAAFDDDAFATLPVNLIAGRLPENDRELVIPEHLYSNGNVVWHVGDTVELTLGKRVSQGWELRQDTPLLSGPEREAEPGEELDTEQFEATGTRTYTIVGICERPSFESYSAPGFTAITRGSQDGAKADLYLRLYHPGDTYTFAQQYLLDTGFSVNGDLLRFMGISDNMSFMSVLYSLGVVLTVLIMLGSISLIYNAFSISVSERGRQFGLLSSIGATKRQLMRTVLFEALYVGGIGIALGVLSGILGIGVTLFFLRDAFNVFLTGANVQMQLAVTPASILIAVVVSALTVLISAWIPARRASRVSAIEAIRQTEDVKLERRQIKTSKLVYKLFGLPGMLARKNFRRNRRRYRSTVVSLFISIVLFVSAGALTLYLTAGVGDVFSTPDYDIEYNYYPNDEDSMDSAQLLRQLSAAAHVTEGAATTAGYVRTSLPASDLHAQALAASANSGIDVEGDAVPMDVYVAFYDDASFTRFAQSLGLNPADYSDPAQPRGIAIDAINRYDYDTKRYVGYKVLAGGALPNLSLVHQRYLGDGESQAEQLGSIQVGFVTDTVPLGLDRYTNDALTLLLPASVGRAIWPDWMVDYGAALAFRTDDPAAAFQSLRSILLENGLGISSLYNLYESMSANRNILTIINVFSYGFIVLISLISVANVFNTISTNIFLRRKEFAMLASVGMTRGGFNRMMNYECACYGVKALAWGLPAALFFSWLIYLSVGRGVDVAFTLPWTSIVVSVVSVFAVVFVTMLYAMRKLRKENTVEALKSDVL